MPLDGFYSSWHCLGKTRLDHQIEQKPSSERGGWMSAPILLSITGMALNQASGFHPESAQ